MLQVKTVLSPRGISQQLQLSPRGILADCNFMKYKLKDLKYKFSNLFWLEAANPFDTGPYCLGFYWLGKKHRPFWFKHKFTENHWFVQWLGLTPAY